MSSSPDLSTSLANDAAPRSPLGELLRLSLPTVAQMASYTAMQFIDTLMLSRFGTEAPTAAGNAGIFSFAIISFGVGVLFVVSTLVSQSFGRGDRMRCGRFFWQGVWFAAVYTVFVVLVIYPFVRPVFARFNHPPSLAAMEVTYLRITIVFCFVKLVATAGSQFLLGTDRPTAVLLSAVTGVACNAVAGFAMVLGHFGSPRLGVTGAAWAQNVGVTVEMLVLLLFVFSARSRNEFGSLDFRLRVREALELVKIGFGAGVQIVADVLAWALFMVMVMAQLGSDAMAANQFMFRYMTLSFMPAFGISQAVTALVGRYIGAGRPELAMARANLGFKVAAVYMLLCGAGFAAFRYPLMHTFTRDPHVVGIGVTLLLYAAAYQLFDAMYVVYNGALRGAGDTFVPAVVLATLCWGINIVAGWLIAHHFPQWGVAGPWTASLGYGIVLGFFSMLRFRRGRWRRLHLLGPGPDASKVSAFPVILPAVSPDAVLTAGMTTTSANP